jgi:hypothetical protein
MHGHQTKKMSMLRELRLASRFREARLTEQASHLGAIGQVSGGTSWIFESGSMFIEGALRVFTHLP